MPSTYTTNNGIELIGTGEQSGTWGDTTNTNLELLDASLDGQVTITLSSAGTSGSPNDLPVTNGTASNGRNRMVIFNDGSDLGATAYVQLTPNDSEKIMFIRNALSGSRDIIVFQGTYNASNDYVVPNGTTAVVYFDGAGTGAVAANVFNNAAFDALQLGTSDVSVNKILDQDDMSGNDASALATQQSIKAYVDSQVGTVDTLAEILANGNATGGTDIAVGTGDDITFADSSKAIFGAGSDLQIYHDSADSIILDNGTGNLKIQADDLVLKSADGVKEYLKGTNGGSVRIRYNNSTKLETTSSGIDVTGTVTADALTVDTNTLHVDATNNRVGIGTSSPSTRLHTDVTGGDNELRIATTTSGDPKLTLYANGAGAHAIAFDRSDLALTFTTVGSSERMRIDSSGNLLVGTTSNTASTAGFKFRNDLDRVIVVADGGASGQFNRLTSDGDLVLFQKDSTTVGSIGTTSSDLTIDGPSEHTGLRFEATDITPRHNGAASNGVNDLGTSSARFKDLYLSGTATAGGLTVDGTIKLDGNYPTGTNNVALGDQALDDGSLSGSNLTAIGHVALTANTSGSASTAVGSNALTANTTGADNVAMGVSALGSNTTGSSNTALGRSALVSNTTASYNTATGYQALYTNTTGAENVAVGQGALYTNNGDKNNAFGTNALRFNTSGDFNVAVGHTALFNNTTASNNTAVGYKAGYSNTTGTTNVAIGRSALETSTTADGNTAVGFQSLLNNTTGSSNTALGYISLYANTTASDNTALGYSTLRFNTTGASNVAVGRDALRANTTASNNVANGYAALYSNTTGANNTANGNLALYSNTTGSRNTALGATALYNTASTGNGNNTAVGFQAGYYNTTGINNTALGSDALIYNTTGSHNTAVGYSAALSNTTANNNTAVGYEALKDNTTGGQNTTSGYRSLWQNTTGSNNAAHGQQALYANTTGTNNSALGYRALFANTRPSSRGCHHNRCAQYYFWDSI
jgi:hypothetical protein